MKTLIGLWSRFRVSLMVLGLCGPLALLAQTNDPAGDIADAVADGVAIFDSVYGIVIAAVVLGFLLWVLSAVRRRK